MNDQTGATVLPDNVAQLRPQTALWEKIVDDGELEEKLQRRHDLSERLSVARKAFKEVDTEARALIERLELGDDASVRVGSFLITRRRVEGRKVEFEAAPSTRLYVRQLKADEL